MPRGNATAYSALSISTIFYLACMPITIEELVAAIKCLEGSGQLQSLTPEQIRQILDAVSGLKGLTSEAVPPKLAFAGSTPDLLAHLVYAMGIDDKLRHVSPEHVESIIYALRCAGHSNVISTKEASYVRPGMISWHNCDFINESRFADAYLRGQATNSWQGLDIEWRIKILCWAGEQALKVEGDFVECGVNKGGFSLAVMSYLNFNDHDRKILVA